MPQRLERLDELKRLIGPDRERLQRTNPELAEMLRDFQRDWKAFREAGGGESGKTTTTPSRRRRYRA